MVRRRLADTSVDPRWDDVLLNDTIAAAVRRSSAWMSRQVVATVTVPAGKHWGGRGPDHPLAAQARLARMDADRLFWERLRHARGGLLSG